MSYASSDFLANIGGRRKTAILRIVSNQLGVTAFVLFSLDVLGAGNVGAFPNGPEWRHPNRTELSLPPAKERIRVLLDLLG
jgi:hypothetical protein